MWVCVMWLNESLYSAGELDNECCNPARGLPWDTVQVVLVGMT